MFWEIFLLQSHSTANLLLLAILKNSRFFSKIPSIFFEKTQILNVFRNLSIAVAFYGKFAKTRWKQIFDDQKRDQIWSTLLSKHQLANIG